MTPAKPSLVRMADLLAFIDGRVQRAQQRVIVRRARERSTVSIRWCLSEQEGDFDPFSDPKGEVHVMDVVACVFPYPESPPEKGSDPLEEADYRRGLVALGGGYARTVYHSRVKLVEADACHVVSRNAYLRATFESVG